MLDYNNTRYKPRFIIQDDKLVLTGVPIPFRSQIRDYSYIYAFFYIKFMMHNYIVPQFNAYDALPLFLKLRDTMYELCRKDHIKFVNVIFSSLKSLEGQNTAWTRPILEASSSRAIPTIDVDRLFVRHGNISRLFLHGNIHWNAEGSFLVGRLLREKIGDIVGQ
jgi:hypothetical protein